MNTRLIRLVEGLTETLDDRLAPYGATPSEHVFLCLRAVGAADRAYTASGLGDPEAGSPPLRQSSDVAYDVLESARVLFGLASRLRARATAQHLTEAGLPLSDTLRTLARQDKEPIDAADAYLVFGQAARVLARAADLAAACDAAADAPGLREALLIAADEVTEYGVLPLVRLAAGVQEAAGA